VTADGFICGPNHETDWFMRTRDQSVKDWIEKSLWEGGVHIMGSRTFEVMAPYWVTSADQLAEPMNRLPKVVFSRGGFVPKTSIVTQPESFLRMLQLGQMLLLQPTLLLILLN